MSKELRSLQVSITTLDSDHLPKKDGKQMYSDDVVAELRTVLQQAVDSWYQSRGKDLLACEPDV